MSFTFSHPIMILPVYNYKPKFFSLFGLVLGSIILDISYIFNSTLLEVINKSIDTNDYFSIKTLLLFYIPSCIALYLFYEYLIKVPLILSLPDIIKSRIPVDSIHAPEVHSFKSIFVFLYSIFVGIITHIVLDEFTHPGTFLSKNFTVLSKKAGILSISNYLYILTSIAGTIILVLYILKIKPKSIHESLNTTSAQKFFFWGFILICGIVKLLSSHQQYKIFLIAFINIHDYSILLGIIRTFIVQFLTGCTIGILTVSTIFKACGFFKNRRE